MGAAPLDPARIDERFAAAHARLRTIATTGTNGKTTTTSMVAAIVAAAGERSARVTTVGAWVDDELIPAPTPTDEFLATVERAVAVGVRTLALEVTSKALAGGIAKRWQPHVGVFTNLTRDHLDYHGTPEAYLAAKAQLFMALAPGQTAVLNADDPATALLREVIAPGVAIATYSVRDADATLVARTVEVAPGQTRVRLQSSSLAAALGGELVLAISGGVHAQNALAAALAAHAAGYSPDAIRHGLERFGGVAGRFERVGERPLVVVDYAHTPDGLVGTLATARELCRAPGRVICVFGCGGDRDRGKRPQMGEVVDARADLAILTTDNPRHEDPAAIAADVRAGVPAPRAQWIEELDRARAIERAIAEAGPDDVVVIAGKGHEQVQEIRGVEHPFSDVDVARAAIARRRI
ncbi:MAG TPA: UDP-N-acetylmuramoyl-L-alanyl-D-glutamate--2,6-diaminopimelate ligase [Kofleriaceae bacterium]|nr:UDP-N-acetylmuramoyl-L-alanyl-D-glutamate--2,6-diaminopimelate ligase [Kofleriaceae bacterium]